MEQERNPHEYQIDNGPEGFIVTFVPGFSERQEQVLIRVLAGQRDKRIDKELGTYRGATQEALTSLKDFVLKNGEIWPFDRMSLVYSLEKLGIMRIQRVDLTKLLK